MAENNAGENIQQVIRLENSENTNSIAKNNTQLEFTQDRRLSENLFEIQDESEEFKDSDEEEESQSLCLDSADESRLDCADNPKS